MVQCCYITQTLWCVCSAQQNTHLRRLQQRMRRLATVDEKTFSEIFTICRHRTLLSPYGFYSPYLLHRNRKKRNVCHSTTLSLVSLKIYSIRLLAMSHNLTRFREHRLSTFCVILFTVRQTDSQTDTASYIISPFSEGNYHNITEGKKTQIILNIMVCYCHKNTWLKIIHEHIKTSWK